MTVTERTHEERTRDDRGLMPAPAAPIRPSAVVWINGRNAIVARVKDDGSISTHTVDRGLDAATVYIEHVIHEIGDRERVVILGPNSVRLALEREYVAIFQRPDRLVDVEPAGELDAVALVERLRQLAA
jgi:hypothetical protein